MKEESKKATSIPDWFNLEKYNIGNELPLLDWALNIEARRLISLFLVNEYEENASDLAELVREMVGFVEPLMKVHDNAIQYCKDHLGVGVPKL